MITNIQALRGIAAFMVLAVHSFASMGDVMPFTIRLRAFYVGPSGVDVFFVISGFIVTTAAFKAAQTDGAWRFMLRRAVRIYPLYWLVLAVCIPLSEHVVVVPNKPDTPFFDTFFLLTTSNPYVMLAWTLAYEMFFYAILTLIIALFPARRFYEGILVWVLAQCALVATGGKQLWASPLMLEFIGGVGIAYLAHRRVFRYGRTALVAGVIAFVIGVWVHSYQAELWSGWPRVLCFGPPSMLLVYGAIASEKGGSMRAPLFMQRLGDASYSIYIWHHALLAALYQVIVPIVVRPKAIALVGCLVSLAWGFASYYLFEKPTLAFLNTRIPRRVTNAGSTPAA